MVCRHGSSRTRGWTRNSGNASTDYRVANPATRIRLSRLTCSVHGSPSSRRLQRRVSMRRRRKSRRVRATSANAAGLRQRWSVVHAKDHARGILPARVATLAATTARVAAASALLWSCFVDGQTSTFELSLVERIARLTALIGVRHFDEAEPT